MGSSCHTSGEAVNERILIYVLTVLLGLLGLGAALAVDRGLRVVDSPQSACNGRAKVAYPCNADCRSHRAP